MRAEVFCDAYRMHEICFFCCWGSSQRFPRCLSIGWGGEYPFFIAHSLDACGVSLRGKLAPRTWVTGIDALPKSYVPVQLVARHVVQQERNKSRNNGALALAKL